MSTARQLATLLLAGALAACSSPEAPGLHPAAAERGRTYAFTNGDFETGAIAPWAVSTYRNSGLSVGSPTTRAQLNLAGTTTVKTRVISGATESVSAAGLLTGALMVPKYGTHVAVVNELGASNNVNGIKQSMTVTNADVDPADGKVHIRFALAPVLENPGHPATQQPYFWAELKNVTRGNAQLFYTFNYANQAGVPWKTSNGVLYTDWQAFDISPGNAQLAVGDTVELEVIAAGCSQGGHFGHVYVDGIGAFLPGLGIAATAPSKVNSGATLTYTISYRNGGTGAAINTIIEENIPTGTTFASLNAPGATCTAPAAGATGLVSCTLGTVNPAVTGTIQVTVNVTATSGSTISNGDYRIWADSVSPLIGPLVTTSVTSGTTYADLAVTATDGVAAVAWGQPVTYTIVATNNGPSAANGATVSSPIPAQLTGVTWTCAAAGGASCGAASGTGAISQTVNLPVGGTVTYTLSGTVVAGSGSGTLVDTTTIATPSGVVDPSASSDVAVDNDAIGTLRTLTVAKAGFGAGTVLSSPAAIGCGAGCPSQGAAFMDGTAVALTASAAVGYAFAGWSGGGCSGTVPNCNVTLSADTTVTASFDVVPPESATALSVSPASPVLGQPVSLTATVTAVAPAGTPGGTVTFTDGATTLCSAVPISGSQAACSTSALATGGHSVVATYGGDATYPGSASSASSVTVGKASTATTLAFAPATPVLGQPVTFTATVAVQAPGTGVPTGTVAFADGGTVLCAAASVSGNTATCTTSALTAGSHAVTATYGGDGSFNGSTSSTSTPAIGKASTTTTLAYLPATPVVGQPVTFTATVAVLAPGAGAPTGTVAFADGGTVLCVAASVSGNTATCTTSSLAAGSHAVTATYGGDGSFNGSTSSVSSFSVGKASTTTVLAFAPASPVAGQPVTFTATVAVLAPGAGTPTGTVAFADGGTVLCAAATLSGSTATCTTSALAATTHNITATHGGDASFNGSASSISSFSVGKASTTTVLAFAPASPVVGQQVTFTATVAVLAPGAGTPTGTVAFADGGTVLCGSATVSGSTATCTTSALAAGSHAVTATYGGDGSFNGSTSSTSNPSVGKANTTTVLAFAPASPVAGQPVTFTATVAVQAPGAGTPTGTVAFADSSTVLCAAANVSGNTATCTTSALTAGSHAVTATYGGDGSFNGSTSSTSNPSVGKANTTTTLAFAPASPVVGQQVTFTVTVAVTAPGTGTPTGTVAFEDGSTVLCGSATVSGSTATCTTSSLAAGSHAVTATYGGDGSFNGSTSSTSNPSVGKANTTTTLAFAPASPVAGQPVTFTATVAVQAPGTGAPTGTVAFADGGTVLCAAASVSGNTATCTTSALTAGSHAVTATYGGDGSFNGSTSATSNPSVGKASTVTTQVCAPNPSVFGQAVTCTATVAVTGAGAGTPSGTVALKDGSTVLCAAATLSGGTATCTTSALAAGSHAVTATYGGDASFNGSTSSTSNPSVGKADTTTTLAFAPASPVVGQPVTLTATVAVTAPGTGTPTSTVAFKDGSTVLCAAASVSGNTATCTTSALTAGSHAVTATYGGDASFNGSTSSTSNPSVGKADTTTTLAFAPASPVVGQPVTFTATLAVTSPGTGTPSGTVALKDGSTVLCAAASVSGNTATCTTSALTAGSHAVTATYGGDASFNGSTSSTSNPLVGKASTTTVLAASPSPSVSGQTVTLTATVAAVAPGSGTPGGTVTFRDGSKVIATAALAAGSASVTTATLSTATHALTATYGGDASFVSSSGTATQRVGQDASTIALASSRRPSRYGRPVTFTATLTTSHAPSSSGEVTFKDGDKVLGTATLDHGTAALTVRDLQKGTHAITASYGGSSDLVTASATLAGGQVVENTPPVAGAGTALDLGSTAATRAVIADGSGVLAFAAGTVELWARPGWTSTASAGSGQLFRLGPAAAPRLAASVAADRKGLVVHLGGADTTVPAALDEGAWHHLALAADGAQVVVLVDGTEAGVVKGAPGPGAGSDLTLGEGFQGQLDEVRIWTVARTAAELSAAMRRPLTGGEVGLVGLWRMDEGSGAEAFDASPSHLDAAVVVAQGGQAFVPSLAWRARTVWEERDMAPVDAGYDADGDPLVLTIATAPTLGEASVDQARLQVGYHAGAKQLGSDRITFALDDGEATNSYKVEVTLERILVCSANPDCGGGDLCVQGACVAPDELDARSGGAGCATGGGGAPSLWMLAGLALAWARSRRGLRLGRLAAHAGRASRAVVALALVTAPAARAQVPGGFALQTFEPSPAGDQLFTVPGAEVKGVLAPAASLTASWAAEPLLLRRNGVPILGGRIVHRQLWGYLGASLAIADLVLVDVSAPVALHQTGSKPFTDLALVSSSAMGDLRLGARVALPLPGPLKMAAGMDVWLPTGSVAAFSSDGKARAMPKLIGSRELGPWLLGAEVGLLLRSAQDLAYTKTGSALVFSGGAAYRWGKFRVGPELYGRTQFDGTVTSPVEALLGGHWQRDALDLGLAVSTAFDRAPGASPVRGIVQLAWRPAVSSARAAEPTPAAATTEPSPEPEAVAAAPAPAATPEPEPEPARAAEPEALAAAPAATPEPEPARAAEPESAVAQAAPDRTIFDETVRFRVGRHGLRGDGARTLAEVARVMAADGTIARVSVEGHADGTGRRSRNELLARRRAAEVKRWLTSKGKIEPSRLAARGFGARRPLEINATAAGRAANRRVELHVVEAH